MTEQQKQLKEMYNFGYVKALEMVKFMKENLPTTFDKRFEELLVSKQKELTILDTKNTMRDIKINDFLTARGKEAL